MTTVITRTEWGAKAWGKAMVLIPPSRRTHFLVHYDGGAAVTRTGFAIPRAIDAEHHAKGWAGIGYHFVVAQAGEAYEGRGWEAIGAQCEGFNTLSYGVQIAIGGDQDPSAAAKRTVRALYEEACDRAGKRLVMSWHGAHYPTDCCGKRAIAWVRSGMPTAAAPTPKKGASVTQPKFTPTDLAPTWKVGWGGETAEERLAAAAAVLPVARDIAAELASVREQLAALTAAVARLAPKP